MKLAFSTLGCPEWDLDEILQAAREFGYQGVEFRGYLDQVDLRQSPLFAENRLDDLRGAFSTAGVELTSLDSSAQLAAFDEGARQRAVEEIADYCKLAARLGVSLVRVFGGAVKDVSEAEAIAAAAETLRLAVPVALKYGVKIALETHDFFVTGPRVAAVLEAAPAAAACALWDMNHPYRFEGEPLDVTFSHLQPRLCYCHVKDSRLGAKGELQLVLPGEGDLPIAEFVRLTRGAGYRGYYSFEWEKRWHPELEAPEVAFARFAQYMRALQHEANQEA